MFPKGLKWRFRRLCRCSSHLLEAAGLVAEASGHQASMFERKIMQVRQAFPIGIGF